MKISGPAKMAYPTTYLECFLLDYTYFPKYMKDVCKMKDNVERLKLVTTCLLAGLHVGQNILHVFSPLNPILGETWQRFAADGTKYYAEQIMHHPPISAATMEGPNGDWKFEVIQEFKAGLSGPNSITGYKEGALVITLADGTQYVVEEWAKLLVSGIAVGETVLNIFGKVIIKDITNNLISETIFDPDRQDGTMSKIASKLMFWGAKKVKRPADHFDINIYENEIDSSNVIWTGKGSYLEYIEFEEERYWELGDAWGEWHKPDTEIMLESDSWLRPDLNYIKEKDFENAQKAKEDLENKQRHDKKLRVAGKKK